MAQTCTRCTRVNPDEALYCYHDGAVLGEPRAGRGGPIDTGNQPFPNDFIFPSGVICRNFDQLVLACHQHWSAAIDLLREGYLERFLGGLGRADLAHEAKAAARFPDPDRGLDQFLSKLPSEVLEPAKLEAEPREVNLGHLKPGEDRTLRLRILNKGMRLLYGTVTCDDCVWLALGEGQGAPHKVFQCTAESEIPVLVRGKQLRAGKKLLEARLIVESNGGRETVTVRAHVPVKPFPDGILTGSLSPRQVAEVAKEFPREAVASFELGEVARWYQDNGWDYPVRGPVASGMGAIQQFFEALGLTQPPKVDVQPAALTLQGHAGDRLEAVLEVRTAEKRPVFAHAISDQPWLEVGRARLNGRVASIPLLVASVPDREGESLRAAVTVLANGNQKFKVPVALEVGSRFVFDRGDAPAREATVHETVAAVASAPTKVETPALPPTPPPPPARRRRGWFVPALALLLAVAGGFIGWTLWPSNGNTGSGGEEHLDPMANVLLEDPDPLLGIKFSRRMRFGLVMLREPDPKEPGKFKRLTLGEDGWSNNTCICLDGHENLFGQEPGQWARDRNKRSLAQVRLGRERYQSVWEYPTEKVRVRQVVAVVPNEQTHLLDTCLVHYLVENNDTKEHHVGLRVMLDTFIGSNDGNPFAIPGQPGLLETKRVLDQKSIPDYLQVLERPNLLDPGTVAHLGLKLPGLKIRREDPEPEPLVSVVICRWPGNSEKRWDWNYQAMNDSPDGKKDSCVVLYWEKNNKMEPGSKRAMAFTYGLGRLSSADSGKLALTVGGLPQPDKVFTVSAYLKDFQEGQKAKIKLPDGLVLDEEEGQPGQGEERVVEKGKDYSQVSWRVRASREGTFTIIVTSGLDRAAVTVRIRKPGLFG